MSGNIKNIRKKVANPSRVKIKHTKIRERQLSLLPLLKLNSSAPLIRHANIDRVRLGIKSAFIMQFENQNSFEIFLARLGNSSKVFFNDGGKARFKTRSTSINSNTRWLFNAELNIFENTKSGKNELEYVASLNLDLNLSKFLNHLVNNLGFNDMPRFISRLDGLDPEDALEGSLNLQAENYGLDGNTNLIPRETYRVLRPAELLFNKYLNKVLLLIESEIQVALAQASRKKNSNTLVTNLKNWYMSHLEIYWEYMNPNALAFVKTFHEKYMPKLNKAELAHYLLKDETIEELEKRADFKIHRNSPVSTLKLGNDLDLVAYGKQIDRVRFEIKFKKNVREHIRAKSQNLPETVHGSCDLIQLATVYAHKKLAKLFSRFPVVTPSLNHEFTFLLEFVSSIDIAARQEGLSDHLKELITKLAINRAITVNTGSNEDKFCIRLLNHRILNKPSLARNINGTKKYCLSTKYAGILWKLQGMKA